MLELSKIDPSRRMGGLGEEEFALLKQSALFRDLANDETLSLVSDGHVRMFDGKTTLFVKGEQADRFYFILDGWVKLTRQSLDGSESVISILTKGETFAEAAMFSRRGFPVNAITVGACHLLVIPATSVFRAFRENSDYALSVLASMSRHMRGLVRQIEQLSVRSSTERLVHFLLNQCPPDQEHYTIELPIEKSLLAGRLGMQPETLSRSLAKLRDHGVETHGNQVQIESVTKLKAAWPKK